MLVDAVGVTQSAKSNSRPIERAPNVSFEKLLDKVARGNGSIDLIGRAAVAITAPQQKCSFASYLIRFRLVGDESLWSWVSLTWPRTITL